MPRIKKSFKKSITYDNDLNRVAKKLETIVQNNLKKKDELLKSEEKHVQRGIGGALVKFDKKLKEKIKDY